MSIVTISQCTMSGGEVLAKCLSEILGYPAVSTEVLKEAAAMKKTTETELVEELKKPPKGSKDLRRGKLACLMALQWALAEYAKNGPLIYYGQGGHFLLKGLQRVFRIFMIAPLENRVKMAMAENNLTSNEAKRYIRDKDKEYLHLIRSVYNEDLFNPLLYDLVINIEHIGFEAASKMVKAALEQPEFAGDPGYQKHLDDFCLACQVKAELFSNERTKGMDLDVEVRHGDVRIFGKFLTSGPFRRGIHRSRKDIVEVAKAVSGVERIELDIQGQAIPVD